MVDAGQNRERRLRAYRNTGKLFAPEQTGFLTCKGNGRTRGPISRCVYYFRQPDRNFVMLAEKEKIVFPLLVSLLFQTYLSFGPLRIPLPNSQNNLQNIQ